MCVAICVSFCCFRALQTYWQTETGGHILTPLPGCTPLKPGSATLPFFGIQPLVLHPESGAVQEGNNVSGVLAIKNSWPGVARTIYGDHQRYLTTYMSAYKGHHKHDTSRERNRVVGQKAGAWLHRPLTLTFLAPFICWPSVVGFPLPLYCRRVFHGRWCSP